MRFFQNRVLHDRSEKNDSFKIRVLHDPSEKKEDHPLSALTSRTLDF
jgi:hypothetical protein